MSSQKLILLTNSKNTTPASYDDPSLFSANLPTNIMLPANCEMCIGAYSVSEVTPANQGRILYVNLNNLPINNITANAREGIVCRMIGAIQSEVKVDMPERWVSLGNEFPIPLSTIDVSITNQDNEQVVGLQNLTEIIVYYRPERENEYKQ